jgi:glycosyltransferase 2 family protein
MKHGSRILWAILRTSVGIGLLAYLGVSGAIKWSALWGLVSAWRITLVALILLWVDVVVTAWRLCVLIAPRGFQLSLKSSVRLTLVGMFFNSFLPGSGGGDVVKVLYAAHGNRGRRTEVVTILLLDRATGMFALLVWPLFILPLFPGLLRSMPALNRLLLIAALIAVAMLLGVWVCFSTRLRNSRLLSWIFRKPFGGYLKQIFDTVHAYRNHIGTLWAAVGISMLAHTLTVLVTLLGSWAIVSGAIAWKEVILIPLGMLVNTLPLTPGGLGVGEAAFDALFKGAGLTGGAETLLAWRLLMLLIGLVGLAFYLQGRRQFVYTAGATSTVDTQSLSHP